MFHFATRWHCLTLKTHYFSYAVSFSRFAKIYLMQVVFPRSFSPPFQHTRRLLLQIGTLSLVSHIFKKGQYRSRRKTKILDKKKTLIYSKCATQNATMVFHVLLKLLNSLPISSDTYGGVLFIPEPFPWLFFALIKLSYPSFNLMAREGLLSFNICKVSRRAHSWNGNGCVISSNQSQTNIFK